MTPEGMSEERLDEIRHRMVQREPVDQADRVDLHRQRLIDASDLIVEVRRLRADGATLREELVSGRAQWQQERDEYRQIVESTEAELATLRERVRKLESTVREVDRLTASGCLSFTNTINGIRTLLARAPKEPTPHE